MTELPRADYCCPSWASTLKPVGVHYYGGVVDDAESLLELHTRCTMCTFGTRTSTSKPLPKVSEPSDENQPPSTAKQASKVSNISSVTIVYPLIQGSSDLICLLKLSQL